MKQSVMLSIMVAIFLVLVTAFPVTSKIFGVKQVRARQYAIGLLQDGSWDRAIESYREVVNLIGEDKVLEIAEKLQNAPKRNGYYIADYGAELGCKEADPRWCFRTLLHVEWAKQSRVKCENGDQAMCAELKRAAPSYKRNCDKGKQSSCVVLQEIHKTKGLIFSRQSPKREYKGGMK